MRDIITCVEQILSQTLTMRPHRWMFTIKASFVEIYYEELRDLLVRRRLHELRQRVQARAFPQLEADVPPAGLTARGRQWVDVRQPQSDAREQLREFVLPSIRPASQSDGTGEG